MERSSFMHQIEPGSQTEQAPPSAFLQLTPEELHGFRFLTISVAPHPVIPSFLFSFLLFSYMVDLNCHLLYKKNGFLLEFHITFLVYLHEFLYKICAL